VKAGNVVAPPTRLAPLLALAAAVLFVGACFATLSADWSGLFSAESARRMAEFARGFFPPAGGAAFLRRVLVATLETFAISLVGTLLAAVAGVVLALPAAGRWGAAAKGLSRLVLNSLRAVPELVWAAILVVLAGLGPFAGTLALAIHTSGVLGRLFAEALENAPPEPLEALRRHGTGAVAAFWYSTLPQVLPALASYSLYRWEMNIRAAAILGVVGAGGLGQMLHLHLSLFQMREAATVLIAMLALVAIVDAASNRLRATLTG
jgi:phosphonate transport system permease protein